MQTSEHGTSWSMRHVLVTLGLFGVGFIEMGMIKSCTVLVDDLVIQLRSDIGTVGLVIGAYHGMINFMCKYMKRYLYLVYLNVRSSFNKSVFQKAERRVFSTVQSKNCIVCSGFIK